MKIIRRGMPKGERTHRATCRQCESEIEFKQSEAEYVNDQRDGDFLRVECPVCNEAITKSVRS